MGQTTQTEQMPSYGTFFLMKKRRGSTEDWETYNPRLEAGEEALEYAELFIDENGNEVGIPVKDGDGNDLALQKVGNGKDCWNDLPYVSGPAGPQGVRGVQGKQGIQGPEGPRGPSGDGADILLSDAVNSSNSAVAASSKAVKITHDKAVAAHDRIEEMQGNMQGNMHGTVIQGDGFITSLQANSKGVDALPSGFYALSFAEAKLLGLNRGGYLQQMNLPNSEGKFIIQLFIEHANGATSHEGGLFTRRIGESNWSNWEKSGGEAKLPSGICVPYYKQGAIPYGYALCDGTNGTPDFRDRFVMCAGSVYAENTRGGNAWHTHGVTVDHHTLTNAQMPVHGHANSTYPTGDGLSLLRSTNKGANNVNTNIYTHDSGGSQPHNHGASAAGSSVLPPYYAVRWIMSL